MEIPVEKGYGLQIANFLRQTLLTKIPTWRPIAYTIGNSSNVVLAGETIMEGSQEIGNNLCRYFYDIDCEGDIYKFTKTVDVLTVEDLDNGDIKVLNANEFSDAIFHSLKQSVTVTIYFARAKGIMLRDRNQANLYREGVSLDNIVVMNSRHTNVLAVRTDVTEKNELEEIIKIEVDYPSDINECELILACCKDMAELFSNIAKL